MNPVPKPNMDFSTRPPLPYDATRQSRPINRAESTIHKLDSLNLREEDEKNFEQIRIERSPPKPK